MQQFDRSRRRLAIGAATLAGFIDAIGFLSANGYFVSFMSGNTTRLGVDLAMKPHLAIIPALLIAGFVFGVIIGALVAAKTGIRRKAAVLGLTTFLLAAAGLAQISGTPVVMLAMLVTAMGALNNTFQRDGGVAIGLTYMTGALVRMGQGIAGRLVGKDGGGWENWLLLWLGLAIGAASGAWLTLNTAWPMAWLGAAGSALLTAAAWRLAAPQAD